MGEVIFRRWITSSKICNVMNRASIVLLLILIYGCSSKNPKLDDGVERISVDVHNVSQDASLFIDKIELVPLETNDSSLLHKYGKVMYDKETDVYAVYTREQVIFTFSGNGAFISNSKKMQGQGPNEYYMVVDMKFNPYLKGIDLLNPYGVIYTYSSDFKFLAKRKIKPEFPIDHLMALSSEEYIFTYPFLWTDQEITFANLGTQQIYNINYSGTISSGNSMDKECFYKIGDSFYFIPHGINYYFYRIDTKGMKLIPMMYLDFGDSEIKEEDLPGRAMGKRVDSDAERARIVKEAQERSQFLRHSNNHLVPLIKFFNDDYVYVYFVKSTQGAGSNFIYNRKTKKSFLTKEGKPFIMNFCFGIVDNVLLSIRQPEYVSRLVDRRLMSPEEIHKMEQLKEDDNPFIIKYYLKR